MRWTCILHGIAARPTPAGCRPDSPSTTDRRSRSPEILSQSAPSSRGGARPSVVQVLLLRGFQTLMGHALASARRFGTSSALRAARSVWVESDI
jgi:hypothetical protein